MSKWHRVELTANQFDKMCEEWDDQVDDCNSGRVKAKQYKKFVDRNGITMTRSIQVGEWVNSKESMWVYKFKNEIEAMAFKLKWS